MLLFYRIMVPVMGSASLEYGPMLYISIFNASPGFVCDSVSGKTNDSDFEPFNNLILNGLFFEDFLVTFCYLVIKKIGNQL